jgi:hypothetical protein
MSCLIRRRARAISVPEMHRFVRASPLGVWTQWGLLALTVAAEASGAPQPSVAEGIVTDTIGRVVMTAGKRPVACPEQDAHTAVILTIGQSNAANYTSKAYSSRHGSAVLNFFNGKCYIASSPLLGADGSWGEYWTELGNRLIEAKAYNTVILAASAIGGTSVAQWQVGGVSAAGFDPYSSAHGVRENLNTMLMNVLTQVRPYYRITQILWHQGEGDYQTSAADYTRSFMSLVGSIRARGILAPIYISVTSNDRKANLPVVQAQRAIPDPVKNIFAGVDTDALIEPEDRNETGHFGAAGEEKVVRAWMEILTNTKTQASHAA